MLCLCRHSDTCAHHAQIPTAVETEPHVKVSPFRGQKGVVPKLKLTCGGATVEINRSHYDKLRALHSLAATDSGAHDATAFTRAACAMLLRYSSLQGTHFRGGGFQVRPRVHSQAGCGRASVKSGSAAPETLHVSLHKHMRLAHMHSRPDPVSQAAVHGEVLEALRADFDCAFECFASPLNARYPRFCSMFPDTDRPFGSLGSFFAFRPAAGSFEANPPFDKALVKRMAAHMFQLLDTTKVRLGRLDLADGSAAVRERPLGRPLQARVLRLARLAHAPRLCRGPPRAASAAKAAHAQ